MSQESVLSRIEQRSYRTGFELTKHLWKLKTPFLNYVMTHFIFEMLSSTQSVVEAKKKFLSHEELRMFA